MPKRSERDEFSDAFEDNPLAGLSPDEMYQEIRWGDVPTERWGIDAPEPLVSMGELAALVLTGRNRTEEHDEDDGPFLAVGVKTRRLYLLPRMEDGGPCRRVTRFNPKIWLSRGRVRRTDYFSVKGGEACYFYHDHERPFPRLWEHPRSGVRFIEASVHKGKPSYTVVAEGIVG